MSSLCDNLVMVGSFDEYLRAKALGWAPSTIVRPEARTLRGRRYKTILVTWLALKEMPSDGRVFGAFAYAHALINATITYGELTAPPV